MTQPPQITTSQTLSSLHNDFVHDISFDHYGRRIATCSGDRSVKVWDLNENNEWVIHTGSDWQAHRSSVNRISWSHPEFGQLLATCGNDHAVTVWEERDAPFDAVREVTKRWVSKVQLCDARKAATCVEFSPRHLGLKLASGSADGVVRIYEAMDVMNLNHWVMDGCIEEKGENTGVTSLSWCRSRFEPAGLVVGRLDGRVMVYRYGDASRRWECVLELGSHEKGVHDVAWAPNVGRSFHLIASAGRDGILRVWKLKRDGVKKRLEIEHGNVLGAEDSGQIWRVGWNVTGSVLASSGDSGLVQLWKSDFGGNWRCVSEVNGYAEAAREGEEMK